MSKQIILLVLMAVTAQPILAITVEDNFSKVSSTGEQLANDALDWQCVIDQSTELMWEVKTDQMGVRFYGSSYTWFDGKTGVENGELSSHCSWQQSCNTKAYVDAVNEQKLCGFDDWRLPSFDELISLRRFPDYEPTINQHFFPYTQPHLYWSSDKSSDEENVALDVPFFYGGSSGSGMEFNSFVRVVRDAN